MFADDIVEFSIATDRRDKVQHATNIRLVDDTFFISKDKREKVGMMMMVMLWGLVSMMVMVINIMNLLTNYFFCLWLNE